jgi:multidrug efflux pump subunit AcrA (membrane-fusion protein)
MSADGRTRPSVVRVTATLVVCALIATAGALAIRTIYSTQPKAEREGATKKTPMLVETTRPEVGTFQPELTAMGVVRPARDVLLGAEIGGRVADVHAALAPGAKLAAGTVLARLDDRELQATLREREAALRQAKAALSIEAAQAAVARARLDVERTRVVVPFDAQVVERRVEVGQQVNVGAPLARLVGTDHAWVEIAVPQRHVAASDLPGEATTLGGRSLREVRDVFGAGLAWLVARVYEPSCGSACATATSR